jgi:hypothetical protein
VIRVSEIMINHARTLLLNQDKSRAHSADLGYEYVPAEFKPAKLPQALTAVRKILFGAAPDNYFLNYRCRELLSYIHQTELAEFIYRFDPRVTYWPETAKPFFESSSKRVSITQTYGEPQRLTVAGELFAQPAIGRSTNSYLVSLTADNTAETLEVAVRHLGQRQDAAIQTAQIVEPMATPVLALPQTGLNLKVNLLNTTQTYSRILTEENGILVIEAYDATVGGRLLLETPGLVSNDDAPLEFRMANTDNKQLQAQWLVETKANPAPVITTAFPALEMLGEPTFLEIFDVAPAEPYATFKNLWFDHPLPAYRLSGVVLALIYRTEEARG